MKSRESYTPENADGLEQARVMYRWHHGARYFYEPVIPEEIIQAQNRSIAANLSKILQLPITRPVDLDRRGYVAGVENPFIEKSP